MAIMKKLLLLLLIIPYFGFSQVKISALPEATSLNAADLFMVVQSGTTKKISFSRFTYNEDSAAIQINDSLAYYVRKTDLTDSLLNYVLRTELVDSLNYYTTLDSLAYYVKRTEMLDSLDSYTTLDSLSNYLTNTQTRSEIHDSIAAQNFVSLGTTNQVAFVNSTGTDLGYSDNFRWNDTTLVVNNGSGTVSIGFNSGDILTTGAEYNTLIGTRSGYQLTTGDNNVFIGYEAGRNNVSGGTNTFIGNRAGNNATGSGNIFIGSSAGYNSTGSNKLYIENSNSATPLIWGDFANDSVRINGTLDVTLNITADTITALEIYNKTKAHGFFAFEDSAVVINCTQNNWVQITNATNTLFHGVEDSVGFVISGDTIIFNADARADLEPHIIFHWGIDGYSGINEDYEVRIYNIDNTAGVVRKAEGSGTGASNRITIGTTSYDINSTFGDRYILQIMNKTNSNDFTIENGSIYLEVSHY